MGTTERHVLPDAEALAQYAAEFVTSTLEATTGRATVALSGGSTPKRLYELLAAPPFRDRMPWDRVHWYWGDERFVPQDDPQSNYRMTKLAMLDKVRIPEANIHAVPVSGMEPEQAAAAYEAALQHCYGSAALEHDRPLFDIVLLGLGEDGHTASLFPGTDALAERRRWVTAVVGAKPEPRISLTYPALDSARHVVFLVAGAAKLPVLEQLEAGANLPSGHIRPVGTLHWMLDRAAAGE